MTTLRQKIAASKIVENRGVIASENLIKLNNYNPYEII